MGIDFDDDVELLCDDGHAPDLPPRTDFVASTRDNPRSTPVTGHDAAHTESGRHLIKPRTMAGSTSPATSQTDPGTGTSKGPSASRVTTCSDNATLPASPRPAFNSTYRRFTANDDKLSVPPPARDPAPPQTGIAKGILRHRYLQLTVSRVKGIHAARRYIRGTDAEGARPSE